MEAYGYSGKILHVDLTTGKTDTNNLDFDIARKFIGDIGISMRLAYDLIEPGIDPLSPKNVVIITAGPLVGTRVLAPRCSVLAKYPLSGAIVPGNAGMTFSRRLKSAGYDHLVITGRAEKPVYLRIFDDFVELRDASDLWGKDILESTDALWEKHGRACSVMCIGQAGENQVKMSIALVDKISSAGKGGLGAVMGSKNLKAIVVNGTQKVKVADQERLMEALARVPTSRKVDPTVFDYMDSPAAVKKYGKLLYIGDVHKRGRGIPYKNWTELYPFEEYNNIYGVKVFYEKVERKGEAPCSFDCPAGVDAPRHLRFIANGKPAEAAAVLREKLPFPLVCARVCTYPCQTRCQRGEIDETIAIRALHRFAAEHDSGLWKLNSKVAPATGKAVAIVGSGPAGLTAAYYLAKLGHSVTVFEALPEPGGMMRFGIPDYRLPKDILKAEIREIESTGVDIRTNAKVDSPRSLLEQGYDALFLAIGAHQGIGMGIKGEDNPRVIECVSFLRDVNLGKEIRLGDNVAVIGGGNAAVDSARTVLRLGAKEVTIVYRRTQAEMPVSAEEIEGAMAEGVKFNFLAVPSKISTRGDKLSLECIRTKLGLIDDKGRRLPELVKGSEFSMEFDSVIVAIGQRPEIPEQFGLSLVQGNTIQVNSDTLATDGKGIFAGGDAVTGPASVIEAIAAGRKAAISIDRYLGGGGVIDETLAPPEPEDLMPPSREVERKGQMQLPTIPISQRLSSFTEVELPLSNEAAIEEAKLCLWCDMGFGCPGCPHPCKDLAEVRGGEYKGLRLHVSSMAGRLFDLGVRCGGDSPEKVVKLVELINRYGISSHCFTPTMMLAIELYERGIITKEDTEGLVLKRGFDTTVALIQQVAFRRGIGETLGDGPLGIIGRFGEECEKYSCHIKGLSPQFDPRSMRFTMESFGQVVNPQGASGGELCHSGSFRVEEGFSPEPVRTYCEKIIGVSAEAIERILDVPYGYNIARLLPYAENFWTALTALGICDHRTAVFDYNILAELYSAATGVEMTAAELKKAAERIWNMYKAINVREGFSRKDDRIPPKWLEPLKTATGEDVPPIGCEGKVLSASDLERLVDEYYEERGWGIERGIPTKEKLVDLGLVDVAEDLERRGIFSEL